MNTDRELMQQALGYMESVGQMDMHPEEWAIAVALRERLAQPDPVLYWHSEFLKHNTTSEQPAQQPEPCQCPECQITLHASDCAVHNEPAYLKGACSCKAQPEQEPVAWETFALKFANGKQLSYEKPKDLPKYLDCRPLYAFPPASKPWVGLTDEELSKLVSCTKWRSDESMHTYAVRACRALEAKLREKNA